MIRSKRFLFTCIAFAIFIIGVLFFDIEPFNFASGISIILTPYLLGESYRSSNNSQNDYYNLKD